MSAARTLGQVGYEAMAKEKGWRSPSGRPLPPWCRGAAGSDSVVMQPIPIPLSETASGREEQRIWEVIGVAMTHALKSGMV